MKILIYSQVYFPVLGGLQRNTFTLANLLLKLGHTVSVFTETPNDKTDEEAFKIVRSESLQQLARLVGKCDLVFVNGGLSLQACLVSLFFRKPYLVIYQTAEGFDVGTGFKKHLLTPLRINLAAKATMNIVQTAFSAEIFRQQKLPVTIMQNPVDPQLLSFKVVNESPEFDFLFSGRVISEKGIFVLLDALHQTSKKGLNFRLAVAGSGEALEQAQKLVARYSLDVSFLGNIDRHELVAAYSNAKVLVVPTSGHMEGSPLVISESISLGTPAIVSDQPAMIEAAGKAGIVFKSGDANALADLLILTATNKYEYDKLKNSCVGESEKFAPALYQQQLAHLISKSQKI